MSNERKARIATIVILAGALGVVIVRKTGIAQSFTGLASRSPATPQDAIYAMQDAAQSGDVKKYLACYTGPMAEALERARTESTDFAKYLRDSNAGLKGIAVMEPQAQSDREVKTRVEYIYQDRNEAQFFYLENTSAGWKISRVESAERVKTSVPYGTPVQ
jgi:hypothetical protein